MSVTLLMTWDLRPGMEQEYFQFVVSDWVPETNRIGLQVASAWYTYYRAHDDVPMIRVEGLAPNEDRMREILISPEWQELQERLMGFVTNYKQKVVETTGSFLI